MGPDEEGKGPGTGGPAGSDPLRGAVDADALDRTDPLAPFERAVRAAVLDALSELGVDDPSSVDLRLEHPPDPDLGDLAVPCFPLAPVLEWDPQEIARSLAERVAGALEEAAGAEDGEGGEDGGTGGRGDASAVARVEAQGPYVNAFVEPRWLAGRLLEAVRVLGPDWGSAPPTERKVILEHTSANPTGPFHVGRARNPIVGDTLARILRAAGWDVATEYYVNDVGRQAAILAHGLETLDAEDLAELDPEGAGTEDEGSGATGGDDDGADDAGPDPFADKPDHRLVRYYRAATALVEEDAKAEEAVSALLRELERGDPVRLAQVREAAEQVLDGMRRTLARLDVEVDGYVWESSFIRDRSVEAVIEELSASEHCRSEDGALYIDLEPFGVQGKNPRFVFTRADGTSLYTTRDVAYHLDKLDRVGAGGRLVTVLGEDHRLQSRQLAIALHLLLGEDDGGGSELTADGLVTGDGTEYAPVFYAFVSLPEGKMSTRRGRVVHVDDLLEEAHARARAEVEERWEDLDDDEVEAIAEAVGVGAVRFGIVNVQPEKAMTFRWEEALDFEGEAAPFVQYAHARCAGILDKADGPGTAPGAGDAEDLPDGAWPLVKTLARFPAVVRDAARGLRPHAISGYALEAARAFNQFYRDVPVLKAGSKEERAALLDLVRATQETLANALGMVGVEAPERM